MRYAIWKDKLKPQEYVLAPEEYEKYFTSGRFNMVAVMECTYAEGLSLLKNFFHDKVCCS